MAVRRLRWQGPVRTQACRQRLLERIEGWRRDWFVGDELIDAVAVEPGAGEAARVWRGVRHAGASLWFAAGARDAALLGAALAGQGAPDGIGLAGRLAERALDDLLVRLLGGASGLPESLDEPEACDLAPRHGAIGFALSGPLSGSRLFLDASLCDAIAPRERTLRETLTPLHQAVQSETATFEATLSLGEQSLSESLALHVGDVLLAGPLAGAQVRLQSASGQAFACGALVRSGERRALKLAHRSNH